jgi:iron complex transport system substrate-binding protein
LIYLITLFLSAYSVCAIELIDDRGHVIKLDKPAQRVIALAPHIVEMVYAVGGGDALVGAVSYSDYPKAAIDVPRVGSYKNFSNESILRLRPDLVLAWHSGNGEANVKKIKELGLTVYWTEPRTLKGVGKSLRDIGILLGESQQGQAADDFEKSLQNLQEKYSHKKPVSVFYEVWNQPLQTLNGKHLISDVISLCGGINVFANEAALAPKLSVESVLHADPQVIVASGMAIERPEWLDEWLVWPQLQSVKNKQLYFIPPDLIQRHTPRVLQGARLLCEQLDKAREVYYSHE